MKCRGALSLPASLIVLLGTLCLASPASAQSIPVTVTFSTIEISENVCDEGIPEVCPNDMYIRVNIGSNVPGNDFVRFDFPDNAGTLRPARFSTSRVIMLNGSDGRITIDVQVWDRDDAPGSDDQLNIDGSFKTVRLAYDLTAGGEAEYSSSGTGADSVMIRMRVTSEGNDVDGDGIPDNLEVFGIRDASGNMVADLAAMGANPQRKDVFVEIDCLVSDGNGNGYSPFDPADHSHCPMEGALADAVQSFANAPVTNLDGTQGVQLHLDVGALYGPNLRVFVSRNGAPGAVGSYGDFGSGGTLIPEAGNTIIDWDGATGSAGTSFYTLKGAPNNFFNAARGFAFRYAIFGHQTNARAAVNDCTSGGAEGTPGNDFMVTLGGVNAAMPAAPCWTVDVNGFSVGSRGEQAGTFMHELGHILGLGHGGSDDINTKPNYLSVMNYTWQDCRVPVSAVGGLPGRCDYSRIGPAPGGMPDLDETSLDECAGVGGGLGFGAMNWNGDGVFDGATCAPPKNSNTVADTNNDAVCITFGPNNAQNSPVVLDDNLTCPALLCPRPGNPGSINSGPDRVCDTAVGGDDLQLTAVGFTPGQPTVLRSFDDWAGLDYEFRTLPNFADGVASPVANEADPDTLREARKYLSLIVGPQVNFSKSGPATILPGQTVTWTRRSRSLARSRSAATILPGQTVTWTTVIRNVGRGPALDMVLTETPPGGPAEILPSLDIVVVGEEVTQTTQYTVPGDACPVDLVDTADITYKDMAGEAFAETARVVTRVLDIVPPALTLSLSRDALWPPNHKLVDVAAAITVTDNCDPNPAARLVSITSSEPDNGLGDGDTANDIQGAAFGADDRQFRLRAERAGGGTGRIYAVTYEAADASGNKTTQQATVRVPKSNH